MGFRALSRLFKQPIAGTRQEICAQSHRKSLVPPIYVEASEKLLVKGAKKRRSVRVGTTDKS